jgi:hypothetical protein
MLIRELEPQIPRLPDADVVGLVKDAVAGFGAARISLPLDVRDSPLAALEQFLLRLSSQLGFLLPQTHRGNVIGHVRDDGANYRDPTTRGHQTNSALAFHSDRSDMNLLLYVRAAREGGHLAIISYEQAALALRQRDRAAFDLLFGDFPFDLRAERPDGAQQWCIRPILWQQGAGIRGHYIRRFISDSQRFEDCPRMSTAQIRALDLFDSVLEELRGTHEFLPMPGELVVVNNYRVMHARSKFADASSPGDGRLVLRTWIAPFESEELPQFLLPVTGCCAPGAFRGGVGSGEPYRSRLGETSLRER